MPPKREPREYRGNACHRCHRQKVKCSKGRNPCRNCAFANASCTYATPDRKVTVRESYLNQLRKAAIGQKQVVSASGHLGLDPCDTVSSQTERLHGGSPAKLAHTSASSSSAPLVENSTAELFVSKLREIQKSQSPSGSPSNSLLEGAGPPGDNNKPGLSKVRAYEYIALSFDTLRMHIQYRIVLAFDSNIWSTNIHVHKDPKCTFKLPPYSYAMWLMEQYTTYTGYDWHWFRVRSFRERLEATYKTPNSPESRDRIWLCQLLVVFALSEALNGETGAIEISTDPGLGVDQQFTGNDDTTASSLSSSVQLPPGMDFFEQALKLLKVPYEEISAEHIEVFNLIALYSYSLNRQRTAYMYAGVSSRMCNVLQLHKKSSSEDRTPVEREHLKRLWWSTFCIDRMSSTQMGLLPNLQIDQIDIDYPSQHGLPPEDVTEFCDPDLLTARAQLTIIQDVNATNLSQVGRDSEDDFETIMFPAMQRLEMWKGKLPAHLILATDTRLPNSTHMPYIRSFCNLHIRYNQCMVLLLRPLLLRQIARIFSGKEGSDTSQTVLRKMEDTCLQSARTNVRLLVLLKSCGLLVRRGFMENMHLFSSLMVMSLAMAIHARHPHSFSVHPDDFATYESGKDALHEMIRSGSLPAREHERMLGEVESLAERIASENLVPMPTLVDDWDADEWMAQLLEGGSTNNIPDSF
ncbi:hypothetical protein TMatcc_000485 [Talaromyces marneffei ATCC 18224]